MAGHSPSSVGKGPALLPLGHHTGKPPIPLHRPVTLIGSRSNARIHLTSSTVSKAHALVVKDGPVTYIRDLCRRAHVYVNGEQIREQNLEDGDLIKIGSFTCKFTAGRALGDPDEHRAVAPAKLEVAGADFPVPIDQRVLLIGRRSTCDIHLLEESCSTAHAVIFEMNGKHHVRDLGSRTGTTLGGVPLGAPLPLVGEGTFRIADAEITFRVGDAVRLEVTSGLDRGLLLFAALPARPAPAHPIPGSVRFTSGRPSYVVAAGHTARLGDAPIARGEVELVRGDTLRVDGHTVEVDG
jgi:pSer/pThr/pTyr-binding forkhead associated (FHA) protein